MSQIIVDSALSSKLYEANQVVDLCDPSGKVLGQFLPHFDPSRCEIVGEEPTEEELDRLEKSNQQRYTTDEVLAHLRSLEIT